MNTCTAPAPRRAQQCSKPRGDFEGGVSDGDLTAAVRVDAVTEFLGSQGCVEIDHNTDVEFLHQSMVSEQRKVEMVYGLG